MRWRGRLGAGTGWDGSGIDLLGVWEGLNIRREEGRDEVTRYGEEKTGRFGRG